MGVWVSGVAGVRNNGRKVNDWGPDNGMRE
jgi:hypothetical protein